MTELNEQDSFRHPQKLITGYNTGTGDQNTLLNITLVSKGLEVKKFKLQS